MNTRKFSDAISEIDDKYYEEAANYQSRRKKNTWIACGSIAAMLAIMVYAGTRFLPQKVPETAAERPMLTISENVSDGMALKAIGLTIFRSLSMQTPGMTLWTFLHSLFIIIH